MSAVNTDSLDVSYDLDGTCVCKNCVTIDKMPRVGSQAILCNACANSELPFYGSNIDMHSVADKETKMSRVCKAVSETINASDMGNIFNNITLTLNEDLDPDINVFDNITRSPSKHFLRMNLMIWLTVASSNLTL